MSIHLVGGGWSPEHFGAVYGAFLNDAAVRAAGAGRVVPRVGVLLVGDDQSADEYTLKYSSTLRAAGPVEPVVTTLLNGAIATSAVLSDIDGLMIGGGLTPAYLDAVIPIVDEIRLLVSDGLPYLGFSAGAMIASDAAIIGGWRIGGIPIAPEETAEDLDDVTVVEGLGLVDLAIDVHAAQYGTLSRLIAATEAGLVDGGVAIDEDTVLIIGEGALRVQGAGSVWRVTQHEDGVLVSSLGAEG